MKKLFIYRGILSLWLAAGLLLPNPSWALRPASLEESAAREEVERALLASVAAPPQPAGNWLNASTQFPSFTTPGQEELAALIDEVKDALDSENLPPELPKIQEILRNLTDREKRVATHWYYIST